MMQQPRRNFFKTVGGIALAAGAGTLALPRSARATPIGYSVICTSANPANNGGIATASSSIGNGQYPPSAANNGSRSGAGGETYNMCWAPNTGQGVYGGWVQIVFPAVQTIDTVVVYSLQDGGYVEPTDTMTGVLNVITAFDVQVKASHYGSWTTVGSVTGNNLIKKKVQFTAQSAYAIRVVVNGTHSGYTAIVEIEAWALPMSPIMPAFNAALAAQPPLVSGHNIVFGSLAHAQRVRDAAKASSDAVYAAMAAPGIFTPPVASYSIVQKNSGPTDPDQYSAYSGLLVGVRLAPGADPATVRMQIQDADDGGDQSGLGALAGGAGAMAGWAAYELAVDAGFLGVLAGSGALIIGGLVGLGVAGLILGGSALFAAAKGNSVSDSQDQPPDAPPNPMDPDAPWAYIDYFSQGDIPAGEQGSPWGVGLSDDLISV